MNRRKHVVTWYQLNKNNLLFNCHFIFPWTLFCSEITLRNIQYTLRTYIKPENFEDLIFRFKTTPTTRSFQTICQQLLTTWENYHSYYILIINLWKFIFEVSCYFYTLHSHNSLIRIIYISITFYGIHEIYLLQSIYKNGLPGRF